MRLIEKRFLLPFVLVTSLFALWGFANDITNPMVAAFQTVMELSAGKASLIQFAFYGGYATMAVPAALFVRRYGYRSGILLGLSLYAAGAFLFIPAASRQEFGFFCLSLYVLTFGLAFLETTANPLVLSLGSRDTSTRRLNLAQSFNPVGSVCGMLVASHVVLPNLHSDLRGPSGEILFYGLGAPEKATIRLHDLAVIRDPYVIIGLVVLVVLSVFLLVRLPEPRPAGPPCSSSTTLRRLWLDRPYRFGVLAQMFYVAAQIMVWTFIIQYAEHLGFDKSTAQKYNICAMLLFLSGRFVSTWLMRYVSSLLLLLLFGVGASVCTALAIFLVGPCGLYSLVGISFFMSLMFPSIYGIAMEGVSPSDTTLGAAFLVMAIVGGSVMPPLQGLVIDCGTLFGHPAVNVSFVLPLLCFVAVSLYGLYAYRSAGVRRRQSD